MSTVKQQFEQARTLIAKRRYNDALDILFEIDHPKAEEWIDKIYDRMEQTLDERYAPAVSSTAAAPPPVKTKPTASASPMPSVKSKPAASASPMPSVKSKPASAPVDGQLGELVLSGKISIGYQLRKVLLIVVALPMAALFFFSRDEVQFENPEAYHYIALGMSALFFFGAIYILFSIVMAVGREINVYTRGVEYKDGGRVKQWRWNEITHLKLKDFTHVYKTRVLIWYIPIMKYREVTLQVLVDKKQVCKVTRDYTGYLDLSQYIIDKTNCRLEES